MGYKTTEHSAMFTGKFTHLIRIFRIIMQLKRINQIEHSTNISLLSVCVFFQDNYFTER